MAAHYKRIIIAFFCIAHWPLLYSQSHPERSDASQFQALDSLLIRSMQEMNISGLSVAVIKGGNLIYSKGYGYSNIELNTKASIKTNYLIGSVTKTFTGVAAMMLWEQGKFKLEDSIGMHIPDLPDHWKSVTVKQLLNHTSGIATNLEKPDAYCKFTYNPEHYTPYNVIQETACLPLLFPPGSKFAYSGRNYFLTGMLIEQLSGMSFEAFLKEKIFIPLGMHHTGMIDYRKLIAERANGYHWENGIFSNSPQLNPVIEFADGGLMSTVEDLGKWMIGLMKGGLLKPETLNLMWSKPVLPDGKPSPYGIGFGLSPYNGRRRIGHIGGIPGFSSCITYFPEPGVAAVLLSNTLHDGIKIGDLGNRCAALFHE